jgi:hypothetical protein
LHFHIEIPNLSWGELSTGDMGLAAGNFVFETRECFAVRAAARRRRNLTPLTAPSDEFRNLRHREKAKVEKGKQGDVPGDLLEASHDVVSPLSFRLPYEAGNNTRKGSACGRLESGDVL